VLECRSYGIRGVERGIAQRVATLETVCFLVGDSLFDEVDAGHLVGTPTVVGNVWRVQHHTIGHLNERAVGALANGWRSSLQRGEATWPGTRLRPGVGLKLTVAGNTIALLGSSLTGWTAGVFAAFASFWAVLMPIRSAVDPSDASDRWAVCLETVTSDQSADCYGPGAKW
jgi:hypothetical protein